MARLDAPPISRTRLEPGRGHLDADHDPVSPDPNPASIRRSASPDWLVPDDRRESPLTPYLPERWRGARLDTGRKGMLALCGVGLVVVLVAGYSLLRDSPSVAPVPALPVVQALSNGDGTVGELVAGEAVAGEVSEPPSQIVVSVVGLVATSGLVHLPAGSRVADALAAAGGTLDGADVLALNLAARVVDGDQIVVGAPPPEGRPVVSATMQDSGTGAGAGAAAPVGPAETAETKVDLNTATVADLDRLSGVGPVTAANIVAWRDTNGPFVDVGQLAEVDGIGPVRLEKLRGQVTV